MDKSDNKKLEWKVSPKSSDQLADTKKYLPIDGWVGRSLVGGMSRGEAPTEILTVGNLQAAYDYVDEMEHVFRLRRTDDHLEAALTSSIAYFFDAASSPDANVCDIFVGSLRNFIAGHRKLAKFVEGPYVTYPRSSHEVRAEIERKTPLAMKALEEELALAIKMETEQFDT